MRTVAPAPARPRNFNRHMRMDLMKLYVGNLPYNISDDQLNAMFSKFGTPDSARVITDRDTGQSKGFGFVEFSNDEQAKQAMSLHGTDFGGRSLTVNEARPRNESGGNRRSRY
jgi:cold-inducible RNA-binding protein